ncbi:hypothetical protein LNAOJCKE_4079 [Methylorubrum aminovorans]|uniref:Uncharacterized protein n=1 Tax=Methylorubrum aminovorans TaxID=269069 RepID=A0ABQ4UL77_9HYPH|nr:hypothetical protein [Methylorubrum aminovorans]GJE66855.1 hypothetical protein LNAOJCKE_4079 [Methylorubrum aminovorans]GMA74937.1 hypothetical protein GCM10025880_13540 [Methylorubrum aminovorans]
MTTFFIAVPAQHRTAIFGAGTTAQAAIDDAVRWGNSSGKPASEVWDAVPATETLHNLVLSAGAPAKWSEITVGAQTLQCTTDEADAVDIAEEILGVVGESIDNGSSLDSWTGENAIDAYAEDADWSDDVEARPALRKAVAAAIDAELADWRAQA